MPACLVALTLVCGATAEAATVNLVPAAGPVGSTTKVSGRGFPARAIAVVRVGQQRRVSARVDRQGRFETSLTIPRTGRRTVRLTSRSRTHRVVNVFRVQAAGRHGTGEIAAEDGARARWSPLEGPTGGTLTLAVAKFPQSRQLFVRLGSARMTAGRTSRRGRAIARVKLPELAPGRLRSAVRAGRRELQFAFVLTAIGGTAPPPIAAGLAPAAIEDVRSATAYRYGAHDDQGSTLDTLKVIPSPTGDYLGVYHTLSAGVFVTKLARSQNLLNWTHVVDLEAHASQPTIAALPDGGFLVAYEKDAGCTGTGPGGNCLGFRHYAGLAALLAGASDASFLAPRTLSKCAEGTPNVYGADLRPDIGHSTIDVGFHYFRNCDVDRQARGTLQNFSSWTAHVDGGLNGALEAFGPGGNIGDRDYVRLTGGSYNIHEVQFTKGDFGSWRVYLFDWVTGSASPLAIRTHRGSTAFANPTITSLVSPAGRPALLVTLFLPTQGSAPGEGGELIYYRELP